MSLTRDDILRCLKGINGPDGAGLSGRGRVSEIVIQGAKVYFFITVPAQEAGRWEPARQACEDAVKRLDGVSAVVVSLTAAGSGASLGAAEVSAAAAMRIYRPTGPELIDWAADFLSGRPRHSPLWPKGPVQRKSESKPIPLFLVWLPIAAVFLACLLLGNYFGWR